MLRELEIRKCSACSMFFKVRSKIDNFVVNCYSFLGGGTYAVLQWDGIQFNNVSPYFHTSHPNDDFSSLGIFFCGRFASRAAVNV